ncbi:LysR family transcriptional regulator [Aliamphritea hakodatensis]|uniref:LysR family transcriptional regulator n=1 Tax=Aliamphritea hakodatensis TaxID=2895352 RepID=UPI0022FD529C|nr:LysR family transcriptional regulator [Aliamphritea hakodatensis]
MENFNAIPVFVAVAQQGGFSAAARELNISKSAVSKRITQLEQQLGIRLIHRTTRKLSLTEAGERYYEYSLQATRAAQQAEDAVGELQGEPRGLLRINAPMSFGRLHIAPLMAEFLQRYPLIEMDLVLDDNTLNIIEQGFDLAIRATRLPDSTLIARKLAPLHSVVCAAPGYPFRTALTSPISLADENCLLYSYSDDASHWAFVPQPETWGTALQVKVSGNYRVNNSEALLEAILAGAGIGRLPSFAAAEYIRRGKLMRLFPAYRMPVKTMYAVYPERHYMPAKVRVFLEFAREKLGKDAPHWDAGLF